MRTRLRCAGGAIYGCAALSVLALVWLVCRLVIPWDGTTVVGYADGARVEVVRDVGGPLRTGDVVTAINGRPIDEWLRAAAGRPTLRSGQVLDYLVQRGDQTVDVQVRLRSGPPDRWREDVAALEVTALAVLGLGVFAVVRRPEHPTARALLLFGAGIFATSITESLGIDVASTAVAPWEFAAGLAGNALANTVLVTAMAHIALTFPEPPEILRRRPSLIGGLYGVGIAGNAGSLLGYLPSGRATLSGLDRILTISGMGFAALGVVTILGLGRTLLRARRDPLIRRQAAVVAVGLGVTVLSLMTANLLGDGAWPGWLTTLFFAPVPAAVAFAILRGEFLEIRAVLNRALVFLALTAMLLGLYVAAVVTVAALVGHSGVAQTVPAAALVALAFAPARARVQRGIDRLLYGERGDPARVLDALVSRLAGDVPGEDVLPMLAETLARAMRLPYVGILSHLDGAGNRLLCERGERPANPDLIPLVWRGVRVGDLVTCARAGEHTLGPTDRRILAATARHVASAVHAQGLLTELAVSHSMLVVAREEERTFLRRELHDRLGGHLVGLSMRLDGLREGTGGEAGDPELDRAYEEASCALEEVRRISRGLRPADLDALGLVDALAAAAARLSGERGTGWDARVDAALRLPRIPASVEAVAYHVALEALTNACRHSGGSGVLVRIGVDADGQMLIVEVSDDGTGINADAPPGIGLRSMYERTQSIGGVLSFGRAPGGRGALVRAEIPLTPKPSAMA